MRINKFFLLIIFFLKFNHFLLFSSYARFSSFRNIATGSGALFYTFWLYLLYDLEVKNQQLIKETNKYAAQQIKSNEDNIDKQIINQNKIMLITGFLPFFLVVFKYIFNKITIHNKKKRNIIKNKL